MCAFGPSTQIEEAWAIVRPSSNSTVTPAQAMCQLCSFQDTHVGH